MRDAPSSARARRRNAILITIVAVAVVCWALLGVRAYRIGRHARALYQGAILLRGSMAHPEAAGPALVLARGAYRGLLREFALPLYVAERLRGAPFLGPTLGLGADLAALGDGLFDLGLIAWEAGGGILIEGTEPLAERLALVVTSLAPHQVGLADASARAAGALDRLQTIPASRLPVLLRSPVERLQRMSPLLQGGLEALPLIGDLLTSPEEQTYLVLAQNNEELRASGGYISSVGVITLRQGLPVAIEIVDGEALENWRVPHPDPPEPLRRYMEIDLWVTRDGNWWPDYPTSARAVADLYTLNQGVPVRGVVAIDIEAAARLLDILAPLVLSDGQVVESGGARQAFRSGWSLPEEALRGEGAQITASRPFVEIEVRLSLCRREGEVWFDAVTLEPLGQPGVNLVENGTFVLGDRLPAGWEAHGLAPEDGLVDDVAFAGGRSLYVRGDPGADKVLIQRLPIAGRAGDSLRFSAESQAFGVDYIGGSYALEVRLIGADGEAESASAGFPFFTHDWATAGTDHVVSGWWSGRKGFISLATDAAMERLSGNPGSLPLEDLLLTLSDLLDERHIQIYVGHAGLQSLLEAHGWAGALAEADGDYLLVVDSNVGYNKVSAAVRVEIDYHVDLDDPTPRARLAVSYHNASARPVRVCDQFRQYTPFYEGLVEGCYWNYVRIYVPHGTQIISAGGGDEPFEVLEEGGRTAYATYMVLAPGEVRTLALEYTLPPTVVQGDQYILTAQKQAGTLAIPLRVGITSRRVLGYASVDGVRAEVLEGGLRLHTDLQRDRSLAVRVGR